MNEVAIIGDIHLRFTREDVTYFNQSAYDLILCTGDLGNWSHRQGIRVARLLGRLQKPTLLVPGNHDTVSMPQLLAEIRGHSSLARLTSVGQVRRDRQLRRALGSVVTGGFSIHPFGDAGNRFEVVVGRPFSKGGSHLCCRSILRKKFGVSSMTESAKLLKRQVDRAQTNALVFLAHNGPRGLGSDRADMWGNDFAKGHGDFGDSDLKQAIDHALERDKQVVAVIAGHMHHGLRGGGTRKWHVRREGINYVNAAHVPRIFLSAGKTVRHHVRLAFDNHRVQLDEILVQSVE
jgi:uncharacterized protein (TIGR04168 family)